MSDHFIKNIEIKNFKCFDDFKAEGFGRVNLIGGKNNVGKTAFMEAVFISINDMSMNDSKDIVVFFSYLFTIRNFREKSEKYDFQEIISIFRKFNNLLIKTNKSNTTIEFEDNIVNIILNVNGGRLEIPLNHQQGIDYSLHNNFIPSYMIGNDLIFSIFDKIRKDRKREKLNNILNEFDNNIEEFDTVENKPQVFLKNISDWQDIGELGHGLKRYIAIISSILINKDGFLILDELENGIHYTHLDKLWEIILTISKQQNVQVFATTHSKECIESFNRVQLKEKEKSNDTFYFEMYRNIKLNNIEMRTLDSNQLEYELTHQGRFRGE